jgi:Family of unknown function (DUF6174)
MQRTTTQASPRRRRYTGLIVAAIVFLVPLGAISIWAVAHRKVDVTQLNQPDFAAAKSKWDESGIASYDLDLVFSGASLPKKIHIEVRDGRVTECLENGRRPRQQNVWDNWTIDNQFLMIQEDLNKAAMPNGFKVQSNVVITLHGEFDPKYGFPSHYLRKVAKGRSPLHSQWRVDQFEPVAKDAPSAVAHEP